MIGSHQRTAMVGLALAALALSACGGGGSTSERAVEEVLEREGIDANVDIDVEDGSYSFETEDGSVLAASEVPESWPDDIPLPDDLQVVVGGEVTDGTDAVITVSGTTRSSVDELDQLYADALDGWTEAMRWGSADAVNLSYELGGRNLQISFAGSGDDTTLTISHVEVAGDGPTAEPPVDTVAESPSLDDGLGMVGLEAKGDAIVMAAGADRYEVDGSTLHVYFGADAGVPAGVECVVVNSVLSEGESAVVHRDGTETPC